MILQNRQDVAIERDLLRHRRCGDENGGDHQQ
jgi:hypothetical protein